MNKPTKAALERELKLEESALQLTKLEYLRNTSKLQQKGLMSDTRPGMILIKRNIEAFADGITGFVKPPKYRGRSTAYARRKRGVIKDLNMNSYDLAYIVLKVIVNCLSHSPHASVQSICCEVAKIIWRTNEYKKFKKAHGGYLYIIEQALGKKMKHKEHGWRVISRAKNKMLEASERMTQEEKFRIGWRLLSILICTTGMVRMTKPKMIGKNKKEMIQLRYDESVKEWMSNCHEVLAHFGAKYFPMLCPPKPWGTGDGTGGYYIDHPTYIAPFVKKSCKEQNDLLTPKRLEVMEQGCNVVQATAWRINKDVFNTLNDIWLDGGGLGGVVRAREIELPPKPWGTKKRTIEQWERYKKRNGMMIKNWKKAAEEVYTANTSNSTKVSSVMGQLSMAKKFLKEKKIYFPWSIDFRGRMYPISSYITPQADDVGRSLIEFAEAKPLGANGAFWFFVHGANTYGQDKASFDDRVQWVKDNKANIIASATDPMVNTWWSDADKPFGFLAFCFEYKRYVKNKKRFTSRLPIAVDGSCNGFQWLSGLLRDDRGGASVNLVPSIKPADIYTEVSDELLRLMNHELKTKRKKDTRAMCSIWLPLINRKIVKRATMTTPYGVTAFGVGEQLKVDFRDKLVGYDYEPWQLGNFLAPYLITAIGNVIGSAQQVMSWLHLLATIATKHNDCFHWTMPVSGFVAYQFYKQPIKKRIHMYGDHKICATLNIGSADKLDGRKQRYGISPNYTHSLDALMLNLCVNKLHKDYDITDFSFIHDSYGTHACNIDVMNQVLREVFVDIQKKDPLKMLHKEVTKRYPNEEIPPVPEYGTLNIDDVRFSRYFFG